MLPTFYTRVRLEQRTAKYAWALFMPGSEEMSFVEHGQMHFGHSWACELAVINLCLVHRARNHIGPAIIKTRSSYAISCLGPRWTGLGHDTLGQQFLWSTRRLMCENGKQMVNLELSSDDRLEEFLS